MPAAIAPIAAIALVATMAPVATIALVPAMAPVAAGAAVAALTAAPAQAGPAGWLMPPVDAPIEQHFRPPATDFGPGHRGIDYPVAGGTPVRAAAAGTVTFAGRVGDGSAVVIAHPGGIDTTYSRLDELWVVDGARVESGTLIGTAGTSHPGRRGLHFGVRDDAGYLDPQTWLAPMGGSGAVRLVPVLSPPGSGPPFGRAPVAAEPCGGAPSPGAAPPPPNDGVLVLVGGLDSSTAKLGRLRELGARLGYPPARTYAFSYRGSDGPALHQPYGPGESHDDPGRSAELLGRMLTRIRDRHPGSAVDIVAHSRGGLVARLYLSALGDVPDPNAARVRSLVTLATPHSGAPLAWSAHELLNGGVLGADQIGSGLSWMHRRWPSLPDLRSVAFADMAEGSALLSALGSQDVAAGVRVLAIGRPLDPIAPADRALFEGKPGALVHGMSHAGIVADDDAVRLAYAFLRGVEDPCGPVMGRDTLIAGDALAEAGAGAADAVETAQGGMLRRAVRLAARIARRYR